MNDKAIVSLFERGVISRSELQHYPAVDYDAPDLGLYPYPYPYVKAIVSTINRKTRVRKDEVRYLNFINHLSINKSTNIGKQRLDQLRSRGFRFIGYGNLPKTPPANEIINYLKQDHFFIEEAKRQSQESDALRAEAAKVQAERDKEDRKALIEQIRKEVLEEMKLKPEKK